MDNTMYRFEGGFIRGLRFGFIVDTDFVGVGLYFDCVFFWFSVRFFSAQEKKSYPIKPFRWF